MKSNGNNCFSITTQRICTPEGAGEFISEVNEILKLRSQSHIEIPIKEVENRSNNFWIQ